MPFPKRLLIPDEELILDLRPHPVALALPVIVVVAELAVAIWLTATFDFSSWIWWASGGRVGPPEAPRVWS